MTPRRIAVAGLLALGAAAAAAAAQDAEPPALGLLQVWQAALAHDREYAAAAAAHQAGQARAEQARALWRPSVLATATVGRAGSETASDGAQFSAPGFGQSTGVQFGTSVGSGTRTQWAVMARQPVLSAERSAQAAQLSLAAQAADEQWRAARQALKLRAAERTFGVALAAARVAVLQRQLDAATRSAGEAQDRFELGDAPVTDTHEANARRAGLQAQLLAAQTELQVSQAALASLTGLAAPARVGVPVAEVALPPLAPLAQWLADAAADNPGLRLQALQVRVAEQETAKQRAWNAATVDVVAQAARERLAGGGDFGAAGNRASQHMVGVQLTLPLYTGGWRTARRDETAALATEARARADQSRDDVAQQTRATWLTLAAGASRVQALQAALQASRARRDATHVGHQVGHRTTLDVLDADNDAAQAELALAQARIALVLDRLRLAALAGRLDDATFQAIDQGWRAAAVPPARPAGH